MAAAHDTHRPAWGKIAAGVLILAALAAAWHYTPISEYITAERIKGWARGVREMPWAPLVVILAYTPAAFLMFPRPLLTLFNVVAFGPWLGFAYSMSGIIVSAVVTYYAGRALPPDMLRRIAGDKVDQVQNRLRDHGLLTVFLVRLVPAAPFAVEGMIAGAARVKLWQYTLGTFLAMGPAVLAETVFGVQLAAALDDLSQVNYWMLGAAALVIATLIFGVGRWLRKDAR